MAFGGFGQESTQPMSEINVTPLVDVMLVLLVIFIITAPLFTHAVRVDLPKAAAAPLHERPDTIAISVDAAGRVRWNRESVSAAVLGERLARAAGQQPQPELHLHADRNTRYQYVADVMAVAQRAGVQKIGFITNPGGK